MMVKSMIKILRVIILVIVIIIAIITLIIAGLGFYSFYQSHKGRRAVIQRIEAQIAEMEAKGINEPSYYIVDGGGTVGAHINSIEDKKFMLGIIKDSKHDWLLNGLSRLVPGDSPPPRPDDIIIANVGDIRISYNKNSDYLRSHFVYPAKYKISEEDLAAFREFVLSLEQREPENQD